MLDYLSHIPFYIKVGWIIYILKTIRASFLYEALYKATTTRECIGLKVFEEDVLFYCCTCTVLYSLSDNIDLDLESLFLQVSVKVSQ